MFYYGSIKVNKLTEKGKEKEVREYYVIENIDLFAEAEQRLLSIYNGECDVFDIKRANIMEIVNQPFENSKIFKAKLISIFVDDKGKEKETSYYVLLFAKDTEQAIAIMKMYVESGMQDLGIKAIVETKFLEVI